MFHYYRWDVCKLFGSRLPGRLQTQRQSVFSFLCLTICLLGSLPLVLTVEIIWFLCIGLASMRLLAAKQIGSFASS
jgi:hypothetical protein